MEMLDTGRPEPGRISGVAELPGLPGRRRVLSKKGLLTLKLVALLALGTALQACSRRSPPTVTPRPRPAPAARPEVEPARQPGTALDPIKLPPEERSRAAEPRTRPLETLTGTASYYSDRLHNRRTASGARYDRNALIAAHRSYPFGTVLRVTNLANDRVVTVRVIDRGPFIKGRVIDLSRRAAEELDFIRAGLARVRIEVLEFGSGG
jgi:rare lipoprotein A